LHIGNSEREFYNTNQIVDGIAKSYSGIPVIITGDLTDSATKPQFEKMRNILDKLAKTNPILSVPGNHDYALKGNFWRRNGWKNWIKYLGSPLGWGTNEYDWMSKNYEPVGIDGL
jgi:3',5'-cyclic AMP phosphodiesterase CpdA